MKYRKKRRIILIFILYIIGIGLVIYSALIINWLNNTDIEMVGKTHFDFIVESGQIVDYRDFINPSSKTIALDQIDKDIRVQIAEYMKSNNFKLREGHHYFNRVDGKLKEYIEDNFKFQKIDK